MNVPNGRSNDGRSAGIAAGRWLPGDLALASDARTPDLISAALAVASSTISTLTVITRRKAATSTRGAKASGTCGLAATFSSGRRSTNWIDGCACEVRRALAGADQPASAFLDHASPQRNARATMLKISQH